MWTVKDLGHATPNFLLSCALRLLMLWRTIRDATQVTLADRVHFCQMGYCPSSQRSEFWGPRQMTGMRSTLEIVKHFQRQGAIFITLFPCIECDPITEWQRLAAPEGSSQEEMEEHELHVHRPEQASQGTPFPTLPLAYICFRMIPSAKLCTTSEEKAGSWVIQWLERNNPHRF